MANILIWGAPITPDLYTIIIIRNVTESFLWQYVMPIICLQPSILGHMEAGATKAFSLDRGFGKKVLTSELNLPVVSILPGSSTMMPYFFVADAAFPLKLNIMTFSDCFG